MVLNKAQAKELSRFFFDVAKGLVLGGVGFATVTSVEVRLVIMVFSVVLAYASIRIALGLLKGVE